MPNSKRGKRATKLPARLRGFEIGKNVPTRVGCAPIDSSVLNLPTPTRRRRVVRPPINLSSDSSQASGRRRPVAGPSNRPVVPPNAPVRTLNFNATSNTFHSPTGSSSSQSLPSIGGRSRVNVPSTSVTNRPVIIRATPSVRSNVTNRGNRHFVQNPAAINRNEGTRLVANTPVPDPNLPRPQ